MAVPPIERSESSGPARRMTSGWSHATKRKDLKPSQPGGDDDLARRYKTVFRIMLVMAVLAYGSYLVVFVALGVPTLPLVNAIATFLCGVAWLLAERNYIRSATGVMALVVLGHIVPATRVLGWSANFHLFAFLFVTFALLSPHFKIITKVLTVVTVTTGYVFLAAATRHHVVDQPEHVVTLFNVLNTVMFSATLSGLALVYSSAI